MNILKLLPFSNIYKSNRYWFGNILLFTDSSFQIYSCDGLVEY